MHLAADALLQVITNVALGHGAALGQRHLGGTDGIVGSGEGVLDHADLRAVAVGDDDLVALLDEAEEGMGGVAHGLDLLDGVVAEALPPRATTIRSGLPRGLDIAGILSVKGLQPINNPRPCDTRVY